MPVFENSTLSSLSDAARSIELERVASVILPRRKMKLFHVSDQYLGEELRLEPRIPTEGLIRWEPKVPHISVCNSIVRCLEGITKTHLTEVMFVYRAIRPEELDFDTPRESIDDWERTEEIWILTPTEFRFLYPVEVSLSLYDDEPPEYKVIRKNSPRYLASPAALAFKLDYNSRRTAFSASLYKPA